MSYGTYVEEIGRTFESHYDSIQTTHNFDKGIEFEIAICKGLRQLLPEKYGICRGFAVANSGDTAGDDILIYDQIRFPTLRLIKDNGYAQKQQIPIEAVYAYIEAKHTLYVDGNGPQSMIKAFSQVAAVRSLPRKRVDASEVIPGASLTGAISAFVRKHWPPYLNPLYGVVIARNVKVGGEDSLSVETIRNAFHSIGNGLASAIPPPDLVIFGNEDVLLPTVSGRIESPFYVAGSSALTLCHAPGRAIGTGLSMLSWATDYIKLGSIEWPEIIASGLAIPLSNDESA